MFTNDMRDGAEHQSFYYEEGEDQGRLDLDQPSSDFDDPRQRKLDFDEDNI